MGGGGKGGGGGHPGYSPGMSAEGDAYMQRYPDVLAANMDPWYHYSKWGQSEGRTWGAPQQSLDPLMEMMKAWESSYAYTEPEPEWALDAVGEYILNDKGERVLKSDVAFDEEGNAVRHPVTGKIMTPAAYSTMTTDLKTRDELYGDYLTQVENATKYIDTQILQESSNARLMGVDYSLGEGERQTRLENYFATLWGEDTDRRLRELMTEYGDPEGFMDWTLKRGNAEAVNPKKEGGIEVYDTTGPRTLLDEEEEEIILGG